MSLVQKDIDVFEAYNLGKQHKEKLTREVTGEVSN